MFALLGIFILFEWLGRTQQYAIAARAAPEKTPSLCFYYALIIAIFGLVARSRIHLFSILGYEEICTSTAVLFVPQFWSYYP